MTDLAVYRFVSRGEAQGKRRARKSDLPPVKELRGGGRIGSQMRVMVMM